MFSYAHFSIIYYSQDMEATQIVLMEYYSAIKNNEIWPFVTMWIAVKNIMLNEITQRKTNTI